MTNLTIRNLGEDVKRALRARAALHGRSMEEEARETLLNTLRKRKPTKQKSLLDAIKERFGDEGIDLPPIKRGPIRPPPFQDDDK